MVNLDFLSWILGIDCDLGGILILSLFGMALGWCYLLVIRAALLGRLALGHADLVSSEYIKWDPTRCLPGYRSLSPHEPLNMSCLLAYHISCPPFHS